MNFSVQDPARKPCTLTGAHQETKVGSSRHCGVHGLSEDPLWKPPFSFCWGVNMLTVCTQMASFDLGGVM